MSQSLEQVFRESGGRVLSALAAAFRDLDLAEEAFADACARAQDTWAAELWPADPPADPAAWLYTVARRRGLDRLRRRARPPPTVRTIRRPRRRPRITPCPSTIPSPTSGCG